MFSRYQIIFFLFLTLAAGPIQAEQEEILLYRVHITLQESGNLHIRETIRVNALNKKIKRGIYRDIPVDSVNWLGLVREGGFRLLSVKRNGERSKYIEEQVSVENSLMGMGRYIGRRIKIGNSSVVIPKGVHTYEIEYEMSGQVGFFQNHDELYWNATGNDWEFPIQRAEVFLDYPSGVSADQISFEAYTGQSGAKGRNYRAELRSNDIFYQTIAPLGRREGLTIVATFPKGVFVEPDSTEELLALLKGNLHALIALGGLVFVSIYYLLAWVAVGRDPVKGTIIPQYDAPHGFSPADVRYLWKMKYDDRSFTAELLFLAHKGLLNIENKGGKYKLFKNATDSEDKEVQLMLDNLWGTKGSISLSSRSASKARKIKAATDLLKERLAKTHLKKNFRQNRGYFIKGALLSVASILASIFSLSGERIGLCLFISVWLSLWSCGVAALLTQAFTIWKAVLFGDSSGLMGGIGRAVSFGGALFLTAFSLPFVAGELFGIAILLSATSVIFVVAVVGFGALGFLFFHLLKQPTLRGRKILDHVEGLRMYLSTAESERMARMAPPERTPEVFERLLPYAVALEVEEQWAKRFEDVLQQPSERSYSPSWYSGTSLSPSLIGSAVGSSLASAISTASSPPSSSSGSGGGGSSGGGGGGGGGGGW